MKGLGLDKVGRDNDTMEVHEAVERNLMGVMAYMKKTDAEPACFTTEHKDGKVIFGGLTEESLSKIDKETQQMFRTWIKAGALCNEWVIIDIQPNFCFPCYINKNKLIARQACDN